jgi:hypothetical protein
MIPDWLTHIKGKVATRVPVLGGLMKRHPCVVEIGSSEMLTFRAQGVVKMVRKDFIIDKTRNRLADLIAPMAQVADKPPAEVPAASSRGHPAIGFAGSHGILSPDS